MSLSDDLISIIAWADQVQLSNNKTNKTLLEVYEGNLKKHVEEAMKIEFSTKAWERSRHRIPPINVLKRTVDKLAKVYSNDVIRSTANPKDQELLDEYENWFEIDDNLAYSDTLLNLLRSCAFEPYLDDSGNPQLRIIPPHQFTVYSNDRVNPTKQTVFIKFLGNRTLDPTGDDEIYRQVNVYALYSDSEYMKVDSEFNVIESSTHELGRIPFEYINASRSQLVPDVDMDSLDMTLLIPVLLADLNYAVKYQSHGIRYGIDVQMGEMGGNPDDFWVLKSEDKDGASPQIGVVAPVVDITSVKDLITEQLIMWLESRSLKTGANGKTDVSMSGVAKIIDNADVTDVRKQNMKSFRRLEARLWDLTSVMHNSWLEQGQLGEMVTQVPFSDSFTVSLKYGEMAPIVDPNEKRENLRFKIDNGLTTKERAVREANAELTKEEQDQLLEELANEEPKDVQSAGPDVSDEESEESKK